jgi:3-oxoacyl-[acyl-carrier protein] reductase
MSQIIVITGTSKGIGQALANYYLENGEIVIGCSRGESSIKNDNYRHFSLEVNDEKAVIKMIREVKKEFGKIDILLNNAGMASMNHILTTSVSSVEKNICYKFFRNIYFYKRSIKGDDETKVWKSSKLYNSCKCS